MRHQIGIREGPTWHQVGLQIHLEVEGVVMGVMHEPMRVRGPKLLCGCPCESRALCHAAQEELGVQICCCESVAIRGPRGVEHRVPDEGGHQVQSDSIRCNHVQSGAIRCNQ